MEIWLKFNFLKRFEKSLIVMGTQDHKAILASRVNYLFPINKMVKYLFLAKEFYSGGLTHRVPL